MGRVWTLGGAVFRRNACGILGQPTNIADIRVRAMQFRHPDETTERAPSGIYVVSHNVPTHAVPHDVLIPATMILPACTERAIDWVLQERLLPRPSSFDVLRAGRNPTYHPSEIPAWHDENLP